MYKQLAAWNKDIDNLEILLFPSDEFGGQELPSEEIAPFLQGFKLTKDLPLNGDGCRLMEKVTVNGDDAHPVFQLGKVSFPGDIGWNFAGIFLFDADGAWAAHGTHGVASSARVVAPTTTAPPSPPQSP